MTWQALMIQRQRHEKSERGRLKEKMPGGRERRRQRSGEKEGWGVARERRGKEAQGGRIKWQRRRGSLRDFFFLLSSEPFWSVHSLCYILGKRDETECESSENAAWHYSSLSTSSGIYHLIFCSCASSFLDIYHRTIAAISAVLKSREQDRRS